MPSMYHDFRQKPSQSLKQIQRLIMSPQMQQAIRILQLPSMELLTMIELEMEQNPVLEYMQESPEEEHSDGEDLTPEKELEFNDQDFEIMKKLDEDFQDHFAQSENYSTKRTAEEEKLKMFQEQSIQAQSTLYEHLISQAKETLEDPKDLEIAEEIIGNLNECGYFQTPFKEIALLKHVDESKVEAVLRVIQTFHPFGVGARNLQESLLIQLKVKGKENSLAYRIVENHFDDLLHNRIPQIQKGLKCSIESISQTIKQDLVHLDLHPGTQYAHRVVQNISPDIILKQEDDQLKVFIPDDYIPALRLNHKYLRMLDDETLPEETKNYIRQKMMSAKWLLKNINQRGETLAKIANSLVKQQKSYFLKPDGKLEPITMKKLAEKLELHESTIARAVSNKYIDTPRGLLPLRYFFSNAYVTDQGEDISSKTVQEILKKMIDNENKRKPLSDEKLSALLKKKGINCARRTVAKYRTGLNVGNTTQRKQF